MSLDPKAKSRTGSIGMRSPTSDYDSGVLAQMQAAIRSLANQLAALNTTVAQTKTPVKPLTESANEVLPSVKDPAPTNPTTAYRGNSLRYAREDHVHVGSGGAAKWQAYTEEDS